MSDPTKDPIEEHYENGGEYLPGLERLRVRKGPPDKNGKQTLSREWILYDFFSFAVVNKQTEEQMVAITKNDDDKRKKAIYTFYLNEFRRKKEEYPNKGNDEIFIEIDKENTQSFESIMGQECLGNADMFRFKELDKCINEKQKNFIESQTRGGRRKKKRKSRRRKSRRKTRRKSRKSKLVRKSRKTKKRRKTKRRRRRRRKSRR